MLELLPEQWAVRPYYLRPLRCERRAIIASISKLTNSASVRLGGSSFYRPRSKPETYDDPEYTQYNTNKSPN